MGLENIAVTCEGSIPHTEGSLWSKQVFTSGGPWLLQAHSLVVVIGSGTGRVTASAFKKNLTEIELRCIEGIHSLRY